ncbi:hypothetical protein Y032_0296g1691 [Ancylostoma ceylanicum]|uniref:Reverse transcriptase domain-containing protein n=1 Tax=Ancylostoma ceylanicum TaxID=53326 RepID=A0A016S5R5_9BILA|nr:hypothetical protein Y032_0296g1691 [Ancylostoma ceylanicum]
MTDGVLQQGRRTEKDLCGLAEKHHNPDLEEERQPYGLCELSVDVSLHEDIRTHYRTPNALHHSCFGESVWFHSQLRDDGQSMRHACWSKSFARNRSQERRDLEKNLAFLDLEKAFNRVPHKVIWYALRWH